MSDRDYEIDDRLRELLAGRTLGDLSPEERAELDALLASQAGSLGTDAALGELLLLVDRADQADDMPAETRQRFARQGKAMLGVHEAHPVFAPGVPQPPPEAVRGVGVASRVSLAIAAMLALACAGVAIWALGSLNRSSTEAGQLAQRVEQQESEASRLAGELHDARDRAESNARMLADARERAQALRADYDTKLAEASARNLELAERLAEAASDLDAARLTLAVYEQPRDPAELSRNRRLVAEMPGSIRLEWAPFDAAGLPDAEQRGTVTGDVVWNDDLQTGYLRFVGLDPNDPGIEQYQVWVIDERGLEQKVSGGVFDVTDEGEVIVPIQPGIEVGRVALFAVTVENPGGTWVPDLQRRVVVAPRDAADG